ncbi:MAG: hypothetical protein H5T86_09250 [Armatimonadetes bacterium]|nr:hypothetical protein [Armatimonadota bacterium]
MTLERDQKLVLGRDREVEEIQGQAGDSFFRTAGRQVEVTVPDVVRVRVTSNADEPRTIQEHLEQTQTQLNRILSGFDVTDVGSLRALFHKRQRQEEQIQALEKQAEATAAPFENSQALRAEIDKEKAILSRLLEELGVSDEELASMEALDVSQFEERLREARRLRDDLRKQLEQTRKHLRGFAEQEAKLKEQRRKLEIDLQREKVRAEGALEQANCRTADELEREIEKAKSELADAKQKYEQLVSSLPPTEQDPQNLLQTTERAIEEVREKREKKSNERAVLADRLQDLRRQGQHEVIGQIEERLATAQRELKRELQRAYGLKLLKAVLENRRESAVRPSLPNLEQRVNRMLEAITGLRRRVMLSPELSVSSIEDAQWHASFSLEDLSGGTREQLGLVLRIAAGRSICGGKRADNSSAR